MENNLSGTETPRHNVRRNPSPGQLLRVNGGGIYTITAVQNTGDALEIEINTDLGSLPETITSVEVEAVLPELLPEIPEVPMGTTTKAGLLMLATTEEVMAGADEEKAVTPVGVKAAIEAIPPVEIPSIPPRGMAKWEAHGVYEWEVPEGVKEIWVTAAGGGAGGNGAGIKARGSTYCPGAGGGGGACIVKKIFCLSPPHTTLLIIVGAKGIGGQGGVNFNILRKPTPGGATSISWMGGDTLVTLAGGKACLMVVSGDYQIPYNPGLQGGIGGSMGGYGTDVWGGSGGSTLIGLGGNGAYPPEGLFSNTEVDKSISTPTYGGGGGGGCTNGTGIYTDGSGFSRRN